MWPCSANHCCAGCRPDQTASAATMAGIVRRMSAPTKAAILAAAGAPPPGAVISATAPFPPVMRPRLSAAILPPTALSEVSLESPTLMSGTDGSVKMTLASFSSAT
jgi:hypothetical protein